ncbi:MAG: NAD(P)-binding protein, partial [Hyphomicrobiaceae bacterium]
MTRIAIIGAGLSGLVLARALQPQAAVTVFDKSSGVGGRMATRYDDAFSFDHGAQYFRAKGAAFQDFLSPYLEAGIVRNWQPLLVSLSPGLEPEASSDTFGFYVATPRMTSLAKALAEGLDVRTAQEIRT